VFLNLNLFIVSAFGLVLVEDVLISVIVLFTIKAGHVSVVATELNYSG